MSYQSDEEQLVALKQWWKDNGTGVVGGVVLAAAAVFGWQSWQAYRERTAVAASELYQNFVDATNSEAQGGEEARATLEFVAGELKDEYPSSAYSAYAAFSLAREAVIANDLATAEAQLRSVLASDVTDTVKDIARIRLARVLAALAKYDEAQALLDGVRGEGYRGRVSEVRGDILHDQGRIEEARVAYEDALKADPTTISANLVNIKLADIAAGPAASEAAAPSPQASGSTSQESEAPPPEASATPPSEAPEE